MHSHQPRSAIWGFTLVELIVSMGVFSIISLALLGFFTTAQSSWTESAAKTSMCENARFALDLMARDIQSSYYQKDRVPFYHHFFKIEAANIQMYSGDMIAFMGYTSMPPDNTTTNLCEIKYQLYYPSTTPPPDSEPLYGWLLRSVTGDDSDKWNFINADGSPNFVIGAAAAPADVFTLDASSSAPYEKILPYVTKLKFTCYDVNGAEIKTADAAVTDLPIVATGANSDSPWRYCPYSIQIELSLLDKATWAKWMILGGRPNHPWRDYGVGSPTAPYTNFNDSATNGEPIAASDLRKKYEHTFTKLVILGDPRYR